MFMRVAIRRILSVMRLCEHEFGERVQLVVCSAPFGELLPPARVVHGLCLLRATHDIGHLPL